VNYLAAIVRLLDLLAMFLTALRSHKEREDGKRQEREHIRSREDEAHERAKKVLDEPRSPSTSVDRLRNGKF
jgi:hypothetical protein